MKILMAKKTKTDGWQAKACPTTASGLLAMVGHALACLRPLAGAFFLTVS
jgi:hypothetical protein